QALSVSAQLAGAAPPLNPLVARAFADRPPRSMADVAQRYGDLLNAVEKVWQLSAAWAAYHGVALPPLAAPAPEELRRVLHGPARASSSRWWPGTSAGRSATAAAGWSWPRPSSTAKIR